MCGINGIVGNLANTTDLQAANAVIAHRGPDAQGVWRGPNVVLGHVRLSIIDVTERSNQPFVKDGLAIVFNGEVYNFRELARELPEVNFLTHSDTEVVLEAWRRWGVSCLQKLRGMFAFAIHDMRSHETYIVRDHFGIKPLFYSVSGASVFFSSELKSIEHLLKGQLRLNVDALVASMMYVWVPEELCIWHGVEKLAPGTYLKVGPDGRVAHEHYWKSESLLSAESLITDEADAVRHLGAVLERSVEAHLVSDVPVNAFLSGGLDSSLLVAMARKHLPAVDSFTIRFSEQDQQHEAMADDAFYAEKVARALNVKLHTIEVSPDLAQLLPKIVHHLDEPIGDSAAINTFLICDAARQAGVKVLLSGMGADEMFAGYRKHLANSFASRYRAVPTSLRHFLESGLGLMPVSFRGRGIKAVRWAKRFTSFAGLPEADAYLRSYTYYDARELSSAFSPDVTGAVSSLISQHHETFNAGRPRGLIDAMCYTDVNRFMNSLNLTYSDRASMAASTEVRVPFIDIEVAKAAFSINGQLKLKGGVQKYILKKVAENWIPRDVIYRPKSSFTMPLRAWIKRDLGDMVNDYLLSPNGLGARGILNQQFIKTLVDDERAGREDNAQKIWHLLTVEQWMRNHGM